MGVPWSRWFRWPQYGMGGGPGVDPFLQPPPMAKFAFTPLELPAGGRIHPPPVRKSQGRLLNQACTGGAVVLSTSTPAATTAVRRPPAASADSSLLIVLFL